MFFLYHHTIHCFREDNNSPPAYPKFERWHPEETFVTQAWTMTVDYTSRERVGGVTKETRSLWIQHGNGSSGFQFLYFRLFCATQWFQIFERVSQKNSCEDRNGNHRKTLNIENWSTYLSFTFQRVASKLSKSLNIQYIQEIINSRNLLSPQTGIGKYWSWVE